MISRLSGRYRHFGWNNEGCEAVLQVHLYTLDILEYIGEGREKEKRGDEH